jgi:hypothetical protein
MYLACNSGIRALPIHCIVEELDEESRRTCVVRDMITMVPVNTRLRDLIQTCLSHMSVSEQERFNSSGEHLMLSCVVATVLFLSCNLDEIFSFFA